MSERKSALLHVSHRAIIDLTKLRETKAALGFDGPGLNWMYSVVQGHRMADRYCRIVDRLVEKRDLARGVVG